MCALGIGSLGMEGVEGQLERQSWMLSPQITMCPCQIFHTSPTPLIHDPWEILEIPKKEIECVGLASRTVLASMSSFQM